MADEIAPQPAKFAVIINHSKDLTVKFAEKPFLPLAFTLLAVLLLWFFGITKTLDRSFFDAATRATTNPSLLPTNGVVVLIDEQSLKEVGARYSVRWPWPRSLFAALIASLHKAGAKQVLMDFVFLEPSEDSMQDDILAAYSSACPEVILGRSAEKTPIFWSTNFQNQFPQFDLTNRMGLVDFLPDSDGVYRHYPMSGSLAEKAASQKFPTGQMRLRWLASLEQFPTNPATRISAAKFVILGEQLQSQLGKNGFDGTEPTNILSALASLPPLEESVASLVRGKVVFVGVNAAGTEDMKATPVGKIEPGVLVHFTAWADAERGIFVKEFSARLMMLISLAFAFGIILFGWKFLNAVKMILSGVALILIVFAISLFAFRENYFIPPALPVASIAVALLASAVHNYWRESRRKREVQDIFGSYVSKEFVRTILKNPKAVNLGGEIKTVTIIFTDLVGFTDLSEKLPATEMVKTVNHYLSNVTDLMLDNGAYVDKHIGDAVMGVFGCPVPFEDHAASACRAALSCRDWVETAFNDLPTKLHVRIGLNTGSVVAGNVGSERKKSFTVMGDAVNLASRLEAANKQVGSTILIGEDVERLVRGKFVVRAVAKLRVKGKVQPNQTYELICEAGRGSIPDEEFLNAFNSGYESFLKRKFRAALEHFQQAKKMRPDDPAVEFYLDRATQFEYQKSLPPDWDVMELKSK